MREKYLVILSIIGACMLGILFTMLLQLRPFLVKEIDAQVRVDNVVGIKLDTDKLYFGTVPAGGAAQRSIGILAPEDSYVVIDVHGPYASLFTPEKNGFFLAGGMQEDVLFSVSVPHGVAIGNYSAPVRVSFYRPFVGALVG